MNTSPDYASYSKEQLEGVLRRIDQEKFPERVAEVKRRLATNDYGKDKTPTIKQTKKVSKTVPAIEKVGSAFLLFAIAYVVLNFFVQFGTDNYILDLFAIVAGASLISPRYNALDQAAAFRLLAQTFITASIVITTANHIFIQPWDLSLTQFRLFPIYSLGYLAFFTLQIALFAWAVRTLSIPALLNYKHKTKLLRPLYRHPNVVGLCVSLFVIWISFTDLKGEIAQQGIERARSELGSQFNYAATHVTRGKPSLGRSRIVVVTAWNHEKIVVIEENWND